MRKKLTAAQVKKLPVGTDVFLVREATKQTGMLRIVKSGRKKMLQGMYTTQEIKNRSGWHYEVETNGEKR